MIKSLIAQFFRYCFVGAIAFVIDFATLSLMYRVLDNVTYGLYVSTAIGFVVGVFANYCLSKKLVFNNMKCKSAHTVVEISEYAIIGIIGLVLTELGMHMGVVLINGRYYVVKVLVASIVLLWNFLARRFLIYR